MKIHTDAERDAQALAMLDHLLAHWETFCEESKQGQAPEAFLQEVHELYFYRTGVIDAPGLWERPLPPQQEFQETWCEAHVKIHWWRLEDWIMRATQPLRSKWHLARIMFVVGRHYAPILVGLKLQISKQRLQRTLVATPAGWVLALLTLWPLLWLLAHR